jgi:hypothetical protein
MCICCTRAVASVQTSRTVESAIKAQIRDRSQFETSQSEGGGIGDIGVDGGAGRLIGPTGRGSR